MNIIRQITGLVEIDRHIDTENKGEDTKDRIGN